MKTKKFTRVRARAVIADVFEFVDKLDAGDSAAALASTALDFVEQERDRQKDRVLRIGEVTRLVGLSKTEIYRRIREGNDFPSGIELGGEGARRRVGWWHSEIMDWLRQRSRQVL